MIRTAYCNWRCNRQGPGILSVNMSSFIPKSNQGKGSKTFRNNHRGTILTVDDTSYIRIMVRKALQEIGFDVLEAASGPEAEEMIVKFKKISLMILDVMMPGQTGIETLKNIRASGNQIPVIMLTSSTQKDILMEAAKLNITGFLAKPFDRFELRARVMQVFDEIHKKELSSQIQNILLVDNHKQFRGLLTSLLEERGYFVRGCSDSKTGTDLMLEEIPDLILINSLDAEVTEPSKFYLLREEQEKFAAVPLVAYCSDPGPSEELELEELASTLQVDQVCKYPFTPGGLIQTMNLAKQKLLGSSGISEETHPKSGH